MLYNIRLNLHYEYPAPVEGGRHILRVLPIPLPERQRVARAALDFEPAPSERRDGRDFFGNVFTAVGFERSHDGLDVTMTARVEVARRSPGPDHSMHLAGLREELAGIRSLAADSPLHFLAGSDRAPVTEALTRYAEEDLTREATIFHIARAFCARIHADFAYDGDATSVGSLADEALALRRGVCQDFSHVMIAGLRGLGVPAGYVSGFIRTIPPPGRERLEGADAMHAWVRVWCGAEAGWVEFDPTNAIIAGEDHIVIGYGRDYGDVAPITGMLRTVGRHRSQQAVDVTPVDIEAAPQAN
jgi:transglutaminase-like putative cysteine protease